MGLNERIEIAEKIAAKINEGERTAKVWARDGHVRVYVSRDLSRGRRQDMGHILIADSGERNYNGLDRNRAGVRDVAEQAISQEA